MTTVPILLYHSISTDPPGWIAPYSVTPAVFGHHLELIAESNATVLSVSQLVGALRGLVPLPPRPVVITFDDGFADICSAAVQLASHNMCSTLYITTGAIRGSGARPADMALPPAEMLDWSQVDELAEMNIEIGAHTHTHPQLDAMRISEARNEIRSSKHILEDRLGRQVPSFAYPHGFQSARLRREVEAAGYTSACGVMNALSSHSDQAFCLARLTVRNTTSTAAMAAWLTGRGARVAPYPEAFRTKAWRAYRRGRGPRSTRGVIDDRTSKSEVRP